MWVNQRLIKSLIMEGEIIFQVRFYLQAANISNELPEVRFAQFVEGWHTGAVRAIFDDPVKLAVG